MIGKIKLVKSSLKESQRLNPLAVANGRVLQQDLVVDNYLIPEGVRQSNDSISLEPAKFLEHLKFFHFELVDLGQRRIRRDG